MKSFFCLWPLCFNRAYVSGLGLLIGLFFTFEPIVGQTFYTDFGQNRVQYKENIWSYYESTNFVAYYYQGGQDLANFSVIVAEASLNEIEAKLEFHNNDKVEIMVYHDLSDVRQTNIGTGLEQNNTGGITKIIGNKIFVYFNGDHYDLARQIREGVARVAMERMIFGSNVQEVIQNAVLLNLPSWFTDGLVSFVGEEWSIEKDNRLREAIKRNQMTNFNRLTGEDATFAGHALWHYISQLHGKSAIPNLLYIVRLNRNLESGFFFVLGNTVKNTISEFNAYYGEQFADLPAREDMPATLFKTKANNNERKVSLQEMRVSPNGRYVAYTTNDFGRWKVWLYDTQTQQKKPILATGFKSYRLPYKSNYPLLAWDNDSQQLAIVYEKRDNIKLLLYYPEKTGKEQKEYAFDLTKFQQVSGICFTDSNKQLALTAMQTGQIDLFLYDLPNTRTIRLTNDVFDERQPRYVKIGRHKGIVFSSNRLNDTLRTMRLDTILPANTYDIFFYDRRHFPTDNEQTIGGQTLVRFSDTPLADEALPQQYDSTYLCFLGNSSGVNNRYAGYFDSIFVRTDRRVYYKDSFALNPKYDLTPHIKAGLVDTIIALDIYKTIGRIFPISNYNYYVLESDVAVTGHSSIQLSYFDKRYQLWSEPLLDNPRLQATNPQPTSFSKQLERLKRPITYVIPLLESVSNTAAKPAPHTTTGIITPPPPATNTNNPNNNATGNTTLPPQNEQQQQPASNSAKPPEDKKQPIDIDNYFFQTEFDNDNAADKNNKAPANSTQKTTPDNPAPAATTNSLPIYNNMVAYKTIGDRDRILKRSRIRQYYTRLMADNVVTQLDNTILITPYQPFTGNGTGFDLPDLNGLIKIGVTDLMEDYRITGGFRIPLGLSGTEYFIEFQNMRRRLDKKLLLYRSAQNESNSTDAQGNPLAVRTHLAQVSLKWPFDINRSVRLHTAYRNDRQIARAMNSNNLETPTQSQNWLYTKVEYVFDNTIDLALNIMNGTRYKFFTEFHKSFDAEISERRVRFDFKDTGFMTVIGADIRHYQRLYRHIVWANRFSMAQSYGSRKVVYYVGAVENWLQFDPNKRFDTTSPIDPNTNYAFQAIATNLRGYKQNARNGSSYAVLNSELRIPVFTSLTDSPIRSELMKNFQIIGFCDVGTAWQGFSPFNDENRYTTLVIPEDDNTPVQATIQYFKSPLIAGYGVGARTKLLGYFVRADVAWDSEKGSRAIPKWYFSLGLDF